MKNQNKDVSNKSSYNELRKKQIARFVKLIANKAAEHHMILEPQRGQVREVLVNTDRDVGKSLIGLHIIYTRRLSHPEDMFLYVVLHDNMKPSIAKSFYHLG